MSQWCWARCSQWRAASATLTRLRRALHRRRTRLLRVLQIPQPLQQHRRHQPPVFAYVPNQRSGTVSVIDTHTDTVVRTLSAQGQLGKRLQQLLPGPHGHLYLIDAEHHRLIELDTEKDSVLRSVQIGENAEGIALSPDGKQFAVCVEGQNQVMLIDAAQFKLQQVIATRGQAPEHCAYTPDGQWLLTSNEGSNDMDMIELATRQSRGVVATSGHPRGMAFAPDGHSVYIAQETANVVDVIDLKTRQRRASLPAGARTAGWRCRPMAPACTRPTAVPARSA